MIAPLSPELAAYPSDYGHSFTEDLPLARRLRD